LSLLAAFLVPASAQIAATDPRFVPLRRFLDTNNIPNTAGHNIALTLGTGDGEVFSYTNGDMTLSTKRLLGSGSKWAASTALLSMMAAANASLDDRINKYLNWWTRDPADSRSSVTLRNFLQMTSGMVTDGTDGALALNCTESTTQPRECDAARRAKHSSVAFGAFLGCAAPPLKRSHAECVRLLYDVSPPLYPPGKYFMYGTLTFNFVAAAMEVALNKSIATLLQEHFLRPLNFSGPWTSEGSPVEPKFLVNPQVPLLGGGLTADATEMGRFMRRMLRKDFLPPPLHEEQERVSMTYEQFSTQNAIFGPYGLGIWGECLYGGFDGLAYPPSCRAAHRITHPGCFGYWDFVSRRDGYYYNFLPAYHCSLANMWCGTGHPPPTAESCPEISFSSMLKTNVQGFLDDIFVGSSGS